MIHGRWRREGRRAWLALAGAALMLPVAAGADSSAEVPEEMLGDIRAEASADWAETLAGIAPGVVSIRVDGTRAFDTEWNQSTQATGFVVDAERGLILTNRHVVMPGPVVAVAIFLNQEEVELTPVYRDPVHDFGLFRYDPEALRFIDPPALPLVPESARVGREIRVVGNDAGEQLSILAGTIARLDRQAPDYGRGRYNDFNTFYIQAASGTSGGSSGSPVIDINGDVVALNAGGRSQAQSSFFLPLDRVARALELIRAGEPVPRGTLQATFVRQSYAELRRLGLDEQTEAEVRAAFPDQTGMLVVEQILPGAAAAGQLQTGDILLAVDGEWLTEFLPLAEALDGAVGGDVGLTVQRGEARLEFVVGVDDLHAITPDEFIYVGDAVVHRLSYQQARHYNLPVSGLFVANPGYIFATAAIPRGAVISEFNGRPSPDLDAFEEALAEIPHGARVPVRFVTLDDPASPRLRVMQMGRDWFPSERCRRDDARGYWPCLPLAEPPSEAPPAIASTRFTGQGERRARAIEPSLVMVNFDMPFVLSGISERHYYGTGLVVDAERGLVVVDRNTVPVSIGDVRLTFAGSLEVPGRVEYLHPKHNIAIVSYDPMLIGDTPVRSARLSNGDLPSPGDRLWVVGLRADHSLISQSVTVSAIEPVNFPLSRSLGFRNVNLDVIRLVNPPNEFDGVLVDGSGRVVARWASFLLEGGGDSDQLTMGIPAELIGEAVDAHRAGEPLHSLEVEWRMLPLSGARRLGVDEARVRQFEDRWPARRQMLSVVRTVADSPASGVFEAGDVLLSIDGEPVNSFRAVERKTQRPQVRVELWRGGEVVTLEVATVALGSEEVERVVRWAGALLQPPHRALAAQRGIPREGVYVSWFAFGSPASRHNLWAGRRIVEVNGRETPDLDSFIDVVSGLAETDPVRLRTVNWNNVPQVITLRLDERYWPAFELRRETQGWERRPLP